MSDITDQIDENPIPGARGHTDHHKKLAKKANAIGDLVTSGRLSEPELNATIEAILSSAQYADQGITAEVPLTAAGGLATTIVMPPTLRADSLIELVVYGEFNAVGSDFEMWIEVFEGDSQLIRKYTSSAPGQYLLPLAVGVQAQVGPGSTLSIRAGRSAGTGGFLSDRTNWTLKSITHP